VTDEKDFTENPHSVAYRIFLQELSNAKSELNGHVFSEDERSSVSSITSSMSSISSDRGSPKHCLRSLSSESELSISCDQPWVDNGAVVRTAVLGKADFTLFSSPELKAQVSYSDRPLSVCPSVCLSVCLSIRLFVNFYIFDFFSRTTGPILTKLGTNHPWGEGIVNC
jgi:hypothetical protein